MAGLTKIVVAIDFSPLSLEALEYARDLAATTDAKLTLVYVVEPIEYGGLDFLGGAPISAQSLVEEHVKQARSELGTLADRLSSAKRVGRGARPTVETLVRVGRPADELSAVVGEGRDRLLVVGTHGRTGLSHLVMGSVAERVVRHARCPVLVVPVGGQEIAKSGRRGR